jgi:2-amino-4-hydroxy-6-hydroxymethyldihydropteridine diphosphokinase
VLQHVIDSSGRSADAGVNAGTARRSACATVFPLKRVYLGLGSNMGDREAQIASALEALNTPDLRLLRKSSLYETEPIGFKDQAWFLNMVAEFETDLFPKQLLHRMQKVEVSMGRVRSIRNGPRTIDIDVLLYGNSVIKTEELEIPHPRYRERRFTLVPMAELSPNLRDPVTKQTMAEMLAGLSGQAIRKRQ